MIVTYVVRFKFDNMSEADAESQAEAILDGLKDDCAQSGEYKVKYEVKKS